MIKQLFHSRLLDEIATQHSEPCLLSIISCPTRASGLICLKLFNKQQPEQLFTPCYLLGIKFVLPSGHGWEIVLLSVGYRLSFIISWIIWTGTEGNQLASVLDML